MCSNALPHVPLYRHNSIHSRCSALTGRLQRRPISRNTTSAAPSYQATPSIRCFQQLGADRLEEMGNLISKTPAKCHLKRPKKCRLVASAAGFPLLVQLHHEDNLQLCCSYLAMQVAHLSQASAPCCRPPTLWKQNLSTL